MVERILDLTNKLVASIKDEDMNSSKPLLDEMGNQLLEQLLEQPANELRWQQKRLENELELAKVTLKEKEMEVLAAQRALTIKDEELKMTLSRLDSKEEELKKVREEVTEDSNDLKRLYAWAQERIGEKSLGDLAIEKLQLEAAQLEVEAATNALQKLAEMSRQLLNKAIMSVEADNYISVPDGNKAPDLIPDTNNPECFEEVKARVARLSALSEQLVMEAGIVPAN